MATLRTATQINDTEFLAAYNNKDLTNAQILAELNTSWDAIQVKNRSARLKAHQTVERSGGANGTHKALPKKQQRLEAQVWAAHGSVQPQPNGGAYITLADRIKAKKIRVTAELVVEEVDASTSKTASTSKAAGSGKRAVDVKSGVDHAKDVNARTNASAGGAVTTEANAKFAFKAKIYGEEFNFEAPTRKEAMNAMLEKVQEKGFTKVVIKRGRTMIDLGSVTNGDSISVERQMSAAAVA